MNDLVYRSYLFSCQEFMVLSACVGIESLHVLLEKKQGISDMDELNLTVFQLYQKGILCWKNENYYELKPEIRILFQNMKLACKELQIYTKKGSSPLLCFLGEYTVVTELSDNDKDAIKIHGLCREEFLTELCDRGIIPVRNSQSIPAADSDMNFCDDFLKKCPKFLQNGRIQYEVLREVLSKEMQLSAFMTVSDRKSGRDDGVILILNYGIVDVIMFANDDSVQAEHYTIECLKKILDF